MASGILVEPMPWLFEQLVANYEGVPGLRFFQVAIGSGEGTMTMYSVDPRPEDPHWVLQLTSFDRDVVMSHSSDLAELESRVFTVEVEARTVGSLIAEVGLTEVDLLHIDAEGFDDQNRSGDLPLAASVGAAIPDLRVEPPAARIRLAESRRILKHAGYKVVNLWPDELAYLVAHQTSDSACSGVGPSSNVCTSGKDVVWLILSARPR